jgi:class 3 adenylate cyclase
VTDQPRLPADVALVEQQIEAINRFPDQNPHPVMRMTSDGRLVYANDSSSPVVESIGARVGERLPPTILERLQSAARSGGRQVVEVLSGVRTFEILAVDVPELGFVNLYGTDVTAQRVVARFPDRNPNPVIRADESGRLVYANDASEQLVRGLGASVGEPLPRDAYDNIRRSLDGGPSIEIGVEGHTYALTPVSIPEFGFINIYGTDITAEKAIDKFPDQNPNPVMRLSKDGVFLYANPAAAPIVRALRVEIGKVVPPGLWSDIDRRLTSTGSDTMEVEAEGRLYSILVRSVYEFGFVNLYGTDITAARAVERMNADNERLLLNILPAPIAARLRSGERVIADRFDDVTMMFADIVDFTVLSGRLAPVDVVNLLNEVFSLFDELVDRHRLEKIKTIGDAYMVVGGLPEPAADDCERVAEMALDLTAEVEALPACRTYGIRFRTGINSGPAVAGVIGARKFIYDVWGDTVNTASRMESHGVPGRIHVTEPVYLRLRDRYVLEERGIVDVRGKGLMPTWFLVGRR